MIGSYRDKDTERLSRGIRVPRFVAFERQAMRKLRQLEIAGSLNDLRVPPGNHLEALEGDRAGQHSVRVNDHIGFASYGLRRVSRTLKSSTITDRGQYEA